MGVAAYSRGSRLDFSFSVTRRQNFSPCILNRKHCLLSSGLFIPLNWLNQEIDGRAALLARTGDKRLMEQPLPHCKKVLFELMVCFFTQSSPIALKTPKSYVHG